MDTLKAALTNVLMLIRIIYSDGVGKIILAVDASLKGWGTILMQLDTLKKRHPSRYESGIWNKAEQNYNAMKREYHRVLKAL